MRILIENYSKLSYAYTSLNVLLNWSIDIDHVQHHDSVVNLGFIKSFFAKNAS